MPKARKKERIVGPYFVWLLGQRHGIFLADGRSNDKDLGRHSLGTRDRQEALQLLTRLDALKAVEHGLANRAILETTRTGQLSLTEGQQIYLKHVARPAVLGGATDGTVKRYRAVFNKFIAFAQREGIQHWQAAASKQVFEAYGAWLDDEGYDYATEYLELTTLKQATKWFVQENKLPASCRVELPLRKPQGTTTYCYKLEEIQAMVEHCFSKEELSWLGEVIVALTTTGLRIGELAELRWTDIDLETNVIRLIDTRSHGNKTERASARRTKSHRDRSLPIHPELHRTLQGLKRHVDDRVFHGRKGGKLKPDTIRNVLIREILTPLADRFATATDMKGFRSGRLHSFRHYFCSVSANSGVPEQIVMTWLGHQDSKMVRRYYHLHQEEAQKQMAKINFMGSRRKTKPSLAKNGGTGKTGKKKHA
jgi:integrase